MGFPTRHGSWPGLTSKEVLLAAAEQLHESWTLNILLANSEAAPVFPGEFEFQGVLESFAFNLGNMVFLPKKVSGLIRFWGIILPLQTSGPSA